MLKARNGILKRKEKHSSQNEASFKTQVSEDPGAKEGKGIKPGEVPN